jgi:hypothetical protein
MIATELDHQIARARDEERLERSLLAFAVRRPRGCALAALWRRLTDAGRAPGIPRTLAT